VKDIAAENTIPQNHDLKVAAGSEGSSVGGTLALTSSMGESSKGSML
jgi:hypothetical protein